MFHSTLVVTAGLREGSGDLSGDTERAAVDGVVDYDGADLAATEPGAGGELLPRGTAAHRAAAGKLPQRTRFGVLIES